MADRRTRIRTSKQDKVLLARIQRLEQHVEVELCALRAEIGAVKEKFLEELARVIHGPSTPPPPMPSGKRDD